jgi:hypothetical protein
MSTDRIAKLGPRQMPQAKDIIQEVRDAIHTAQSLGVFDKINRAHLTRRCLWDGQSDDGMLHGDNAFPWDMAIDSKVPLADEIVTEHVRVRMAAVRAGHVQIGPMNEIADSGKAKLWDDVLKYYRAQVRRSLKNHWRLFQTCVEEIGYGVLQVDWRENKVLKPLEMTRERMISFAAQQTLALMMQETQMNEEPPPEWQQQAADLATMQVEELLINPMLRNDALALLMQVDPTMPESEARKILPGLRKDGVATYYAPRGSGGQACVKARIPWVDCGHAMDLGPEGKCSWWFVAEWLSEVDFRIRCEQEKCSDAWRDAVLAQGNKGMSEMMQGMVTVPDWLLNGVGVGLSYDRQQNQNAPMFQVLTVYRLAVNEAGIPACYETLVHAQVPDLLGKHECCEVAELPFIAEAREAAALMMQSRGVPEILLTDQLQLKKLKDGTTHMAELASFPPYERAMGDSSRIAPGAELPVRRNTGSSGTQSRFLDLPGVDMGALKAMEMVRTDVDRLFMRGATVDPDARRLFLEELSESAVMSYEELMRLMWLHVQAYVDEVVASRIAGRPVSVSATAEDLEGTADITVEFSVMALNQKTALELAEYVTKLAGLDRSGRIDFGRAIELITRIFDPVLSENIILPGEAAAAEIEKDEQNVISALAQGQWVTGRVNSPQARWQVFQRWLANPETVPMLQAKPAIYIGVMEHIKGLQQEMVQKQQNVFTGQTGQKQEAPWEEGAQPEQALRGMVEGGMQPAMAA